MPTGNVEVVLKEFKIINVSKKQLPFAIRDFQKVNAVIDKCKLGSCTGYCKEFLKICMSKYLTCFINYELCINACACNTPFLNFFLHSRSKEFHDIKNVASYYCNDFQHT
jgi:hypothetical protein